MEQITNVSACINTELTKNSVLQRELYDVSDEKEELRSILIPGVIKKSRNVHTYIKIARRIVSDEYYFDVSNMFNVLLFTDLWQTLPEIRVKENFKEKIQVKWCDDIGLNIVERASLTNGTSVFQSMDSIWINMYYNFFMNKQDYNKIIGNVPELTTWSTYLPETKLIIPQCWDYCRSISKALPVGLCKDIISHVYKMRDKVSSLLRIRIKKDDTWNEARLIDCEFKEFPLEGLNINSTLPQPELYGGYANSTADEWTWRQEEKQVMYTYDVISIPGEIRYEEGKKFQIPLDIYNAAYCIFFVAECTENINHNVYSDFSMNNHNPISTVALMYGNNYKIPEIDSMYTSKIVPLRFFNKNIETPGYNVICLGFDPTSSDIDITTTLGDLNAKLILQLNRESSPKDNEKVDDIIIRGLNNDNKKVYNIYVRVMIYRKLVFENGSCYIDNKTI